MNVVRHFRQCNKFEHAPYVKSLDVSLHNCLRLPVADISLSSTIANSTRLVVRSSFYFSPRPPSFRCYMSSKVAGQPKSRWSVAKASWVFRCSSGTRSRRRGRWFKARAACFLLSLDRVDTNELKMTQQLVAEMLGVRREGVTEAAQELQDLGMIRYRRGHITVLDRPAMERCAGECYTVVKADYASLPAT